MARLEPGVGAEVGAVGQSEVRSAGARPSQAWGPVELRGPTAAGTADLRCTDGRRGGVCEPGQEKTLSQDTTESQNLPALHPHAASDRPIRNKEAQMRLKKCSTCLSMRLYFFVTLCLYGVHRKALFWKDIHCRETG